jgi:hypothetical protein
VNCSLPSTWHSLPWLRNSTRCYDRWILSETHPIPEGSSALRARFLKFVSNLALCAFIYRAPTSFQVNLRPDDEEHKPNDHVEWLQMERHHMSKQMVDVLFSLEPPGSQTKAADAFLEMLPESMLRKVLAVLTAIPHKSLLQNTTDSLLLEIRRKLDKVRLAPHL